MPDSATRESTIQKLANKVPEITIFFWIIKILCTTVGETFADYINFNLNLGLTMTSVVMSVLLVICLVVQIRSKKYTPSLYWLAVVLLSIVGTLITDNLTDNLGVSLITSSIVFSVALAGGASVTRATRLPNSARACLALTCRPSTRCTPGSVDR